jgi:Protein of unknown function (DUF2442)
VEKMAHMTRPRLLSVETFDDFKMKLLFINGSVFTIDFKQFFTESPGLAPLRDPVEFAKATVIAGEGWTVEWVDRDIQIGADTLWLDAQAQNAPDEYTRFFAGWRTRYGLGLKQAAEALGVTPRTISAYSSGARPIPKTVQLACIGWETLKKAA